MVISMLCAQATSKTRSLLTPSIDVGIDCTDTPTPFLVLAQRIEFGLFLMLEQSSLRR